MTDARISYGKLRVPVHRVGGRPLAGLPEIPESPVRTLSGALLAAEVSLEVLGQGFLPAYTAGDNRRVVATDTMKNVILRRALAYDGATLEGLLHSLGGHFLVTYAEMERLRLHAEEIPFAAVTVGGGATPSDRLFRLTAGDRATAQLELDRTGLGGHRSGVEGLRLLKTTGSGFTSSRATPTPRCRSAATGRC